MKSKRLSSGFIALVFSSLLVSGCANTTLNKSAGIQKITESSGPSIVEQQTALEAYSVSMDVNPSISFTVKEGFVDAVTARNDDGVSILLGADVAGLTVQDAIHKIIDALVAQGYMEDSGIKPYLIVTVSGEKSDDLTAGKIKQYAKDVLKIYEIDCEVDSKYVSVDEAKRAEPLGLSVGRFMIIKHIAEQQGISIEQAKKIYGSMGIGHLVGKFEGIKRLFKGKDLDGDGTPGLSVEQKAILKSALDTFKENVKEAKKVYLNERYDIKAEYIKASQELRKQNKKDLPALQVELNALKKAMLNKIVESLYDEYDSIEAAKSAFIGAVVNTVIPKDILMNYLEDTLAES